MPALDHADPAFASLLGEAIIALSYSLCGVAPDAPVPAGGVVQGFDKLHPTYVRVTEGRDGPGPAQRAHYSSCGDQLHALLERIGVRNESWVNRKSLGHYRDGGNIVQLEHPTCPCAKSAPRDATYRPPSGSLCLIWTTGLDAHALVWLGPGSDERHARTANYGAGGMSASTAPGANVADSPALWDGRTLRIGGARRILQSVITPEAIVPYITAQIDLTGAPVTGELIDALGARYG